MVAYSFKQRFAPQIIAGLQTGPLVVGMKRQTIRADRKRHARPGEELQLYTGMRTRSCQLLGRTTCTAVAPVRLLLGRSPSVEIGGSPPSPMMRDWTCSLASTALRTGRTCAPSGLRSMPR